METANISTTAKHSEVTTMTPTYYFQTRDGEVAELILAENAVLVRTLRGIKVFNQSTIRSWKNVGGR